MDQCDEAALVLKARVLNYRFFSLLFGDVVDEESVAALGDESVAQSFEVLAGLEGPLAQSYDEALRVMAERLRGLPEDEAALRLLEKEYTALFVGPIEIEVSPWESSYTGDPRILFQKETVDVRNEYRKQGFLPAQYPTVADDHLALECSFLAELAKRAVDAEEASDDEGLAIALSASAAFLDEHLLRWLPSMGEKMAGSRSADFYGDAVRFALAYARLDRALISELMA